MKKLIQCYQSSTYYTLVPTRLTEVRRRKNSPHSRIEESKSMRRPISRKKKLKGNLHALTQQIKDMKKANSRGFSKLNRKMKTMKKLNKTFQKQFLRQKSAHCERCISSISTRNLWKPPGPDPPKISKSSKKLIQTHYLHPPIEIEPRSKSKPYNYSLQTKIPRSQEDITVRVVRRKPIPRMMPMQLTPQIKNDIEKLTQKYQGCFGHKNVANSVYKKLDKKTKELYKIRDLEKYAHVCRKECRKKYEKQENKEESKNDSDSNDEDKQKLPVEIITSSEEDSTKQYKVKIYSFQKE
ncbi:unnamed protein product [Moneuplotes crassus]|uniref:Uncharacterized protein n=1 Tax=Euplotes crassus TaxID=5936 RepID=A0AAD1XJ31_EUPCR|nr:unnamed protein product [Moneuplotes crassus]